MVAIMNLNREAILTIAALVACTSATPSSSSTSSLKTLTKTSKASTTTATPTAIIDTSGTPYFISLANPKVIENTQVWGALINVSNDTEISPLSISNPADVLSNFSSCDGWKPAHGEAEIFEIVGVSTNVTDASLPPLLSLFDQELKLGYDLQVANDSADCTSYTAIETVPFGVNIGNDGSYNGSLVLGGWYDANRIASTSWHLVAESVYNSSFLSGGVLDVSVIVNGTIYDAILDFGYDSIDLPRALESACANDSFVIAFPGTFLGQAAIDIPISSNFTGTGNCDWDYDGVEDGPIHLGLPFWQAAYTYVDKMGHVYLTAANQLNATSRSMEPFDANATLKLPAGVTQYTAPSDTKKSMAVSSFVLPYGIGWNIAVLGLLIACVAN